MNKLSSYEMALLITSSIAVRIPDPSCPLFELLHVGFKLGSFNYLLCRPTQALDEWTDGLNLFKEAGQEIKREERGERLEHVFIWCKKLQYPFKDKGENRYFIWNINTHTLSKIFTQCKIKQDQDVRPDTGSSINQVYTRSSFLTIWPQLAMSKKTFSFDKIVKKF